MSRGRILSALVLVALASPLAFPVFAIFHDRSAWSVWNERTRIGLLVGNTFSLATGAILVAVPLGTLLAILLCRVRIAG